MKFGLKQFAEKTPLLMKRLSLALKTGAATALTYALISENKTYAMYCAVAAIAASVLTSLFGEKSLNDKAQE
jgi:hypothetical protein